jgi:hypothetical protein
MKERMSEKDFVEALRLNYAKVVFSDSKSYKKAIKYMGFELYGKADMYMYKGIPFVYELTND